ncbi:MAG: SprT-like domain-containing protein [Nitrospirota bacterium]
MIDGGFQMNLPYSLNCDDLRDYIEMLTGKSVTLSLTDNSVRMVTVKSGEDAVSVRLHWIFLHAGTEVINEVASFIKNPKGRTPLINKFIDENRNCLRQRNPRTFNEKTQGKYHDLQELFASLNREYFEGRISASIDWGRGSLRRAVRKRTLGSYCRRSNAIRISPVLDRKNVPRYFIKYVIYHEMLHSDIVEDRRNGRRVVHSSEFKRRERIFKEYRKAMSWDEKH